jgi:hypothetical protein
MLIVFLFKYAYWKKLFFEIMSIWKNNDAILIKVWKTHFYLYFLLVFFSFGTVLGFSCLIWSFVLAASIWPSCFNSPDIFYFFPYYYLFFYSCFNIIVLCIVSSLLKYNQNKFFNINEFPLIIHLFKNFEVYSTVSLKDKLFWSLIPAIFFFTIFFLKDCIFLNLLDTLLDFHSSSKIQEVKRTEIIVNYYKEIAAQILQKYPNSSSDEINVISSSLDKEVRKAGELTFQDLKELKTIVKKN